MPDQQTEFRGIPMMDSSISKRVAAYNACIALYKFGLLDGSMEPTVPIETTESNRSINHDERIIKSVTISDENFYKKKIPLRLSLTSKWRHLLEDKTEHIL